MLDIYKYIFSVFYAFIVIKMSNLYMIDTRTLSTSYLIKYKLIKSKRKSHLQKFMSFIWNVTE